jgi:hypothetical protein
VRQALQLVQRMREVSKSFFQRAWVVAYGQGEYDREGRKIPPYGVYTGLEARLAEYLRDMEEKLIGMGIANWPVIVCPIYRDTLLEMCSGYKKWEDRGKSDAAADDLWNNPLPKDLSAVIGAINDRLREARDYELADEIRGRQGAS